MSLLIPLNRFARIRPSVPNHAISKRWRKLFLPRRDRSRLNIAIQVTPELTPKMESAGTAFGRGYWKALDSWPWKDRNFFG
jgi:hypothetical protein